MRKPLIGLVPLVDEERESLWMLPGYMEGISAAGGLPLMFPLTGDPEEISQLVQTFDGFLFTGGQDVSPALYGEDPVSACGVPCNPRDQMENLLLREILEKDKPVLGICRGIQVFNVLLGGSLYQDLPSQYNTKINHHQSPPYDRPVHRVKIIPDTPLFRLLGKEQLAVNSYHHQAVKTLAKILLPMACSEDGLIEAVYMKNQSFVWALQWHPEFSFRVNDDSRKIFQAFLDQCRLCKT